MNGIRLSNVRENFQPELRVESALYISNVELELLVHR